MSSEIDRSIEAMDAASEMLEKLAAKLAELSPHKGNDLPEDAGNLLVRAKLPAAGKLPPCASWFEAEFLAGRWHDVTSGESFPLEWVTHWMRVPEVEP